VLVRLGLTPVRIVKDEGEFGLEMESGEALGAGGR